MRNSVEAGRVDSPCWRLSGRHFCVVFGLLGFFDSCWSFFSFLPCSLENAILAGYALSSFYSFRFRNYAKPAKLLNFFSGYIIIEIGIIVNIGKIVVQTATEIWVKTFVAPRTLKSRGLGRFIKQLLFENVRKWPFLMYM